MKLVEERIKKIREEFGKISHKIHQITESRLREQELTTILILPTGHCVYPGTSENGKSIILDLDRASFFRRFCS